LIGATIAIFVIGRAAINAGRWNWRAVYRGRLHLLRSCGRRALRVHLRRRESALPRTLDILLHVGLGNVRLPLNLWWRLVHAADRGLCRLNGPSTELLGGIEARSRCDPWSAGLQSRRWLAELAWRAGVRIDEGLPIAAESRLSRDVAWRIVGRNRWAAGRRGGGREAVDLIALVLLSDPLIAKST
jgi:hypothetical protein